MPGFYGLWLLSLWGNRPRDSKPRRPLRFGGPLVRCCRNFSAHVTASEQVTNKENNKGYEGAHLRFFSDALAAR